MSDKGRTDALSLKNWMGSNSDTLSFAEFLEKMKDPIAADLVRSIKGFTKQFEDRSAHGAVKTDPDADSGIVQDFLAKTEGIFQVHPLWKGSTVLEQAVDCLEKYVMSKIWRYTFAVHREDIDRDERYYRLSNALSFVDLDTLVGAPFPADGSMISLAQGELLKMDKYKAPMDKLVCLANVRRMVEASIAAAVRAGADIGGADAFFPTFLYVVLHAHPPKLSSNIEYMKRYRMRSRLSGEFDYMLANLESTALYLDTVNWEHLKISKDDFVAKLSAAGIPEATTSELEKLGGGRVSPSRTDVLTMNEEEEEEEEEEGKEGCAATATNKDDEKSTASEDLLSISQQAQSLVYQKDDQLIEEMIVQGTNAVLQLESAGVLQEKYPYMYAAPETLSVGDVGAVLGQYREAIFRFEALSAALKQQLGKYVEKNLNNGSSMAQQMPVYSAVGSSAAGMAEAALASLGGAADTLMKRFSRNSATATDSIKDEKQQKVFQSLFGTPSARTSPEKQQGLCTPSPIAQLTLETQSLIDMDPTNYSPPKEEITSLI